MMGQVSGYSASMSSDGKRVAIGAYRNDGTDTDAGHVRVYAESGGTWTQVGSDIDGEAAGDWSGYSVSISSDGTRVAIGAHKNDGTGTDAGHVRVYAESGGMDAGGLRHRRRGCGRRVRVLGIDVLGRQARGDRRFLPTTATATAPATCGCTRRAAGRGPRWGTTSTARLRATTPGGRYRCPRTDRAWRSALRERRRRPRARVRRERRDVDAGGLRHRRRGCGRRVRVLGIDVLRTASAWRSALP